jgi:carboxylate-amine ligase
MQHASDHAYTFGIEEEFFLCHASSGTVASRVPQGLIEACEQRYSGRVSAELLQAQIETSTAICRHPEEARLALTRLRRGVAGIAGDFDLKLIAAGTHPLAEWREQAPTGKPRYERLLDDFQIVGQRSLLCGLHVHVAVPPGADRVSLMNRAAHWLPMFLALSTSSPFWNRQRTGLMSYRQSAYDEWPRSGTPDFFVNEAEYRAWIKLLLQAGALPDASFVWWAIRPSMRYPTLELRIADACTEVEDAIAIAMLFRCLIRALLRSPALGADASAFARALIEENRWRAKRYGIERGPIDASRVAVRPFDEALTDMLALLAPDAEALDCGQELEHARRIVQRGTSAHRQLAIYRQWRQAGASRLLALRQVVAWLMAASVPEAGGSHVWDGAERSAFAPP